MDTDDYLSTTFLTSYFSDIAVYPLTWPVTLALTGGVLLLLASALMSGSEVAFFSLTPAHLEQVRSHKKPSDTVLERLLNDSERLLGTILVANNMVNVAIVMLFNYAFDNLFDFSKAPTMGFLFQVVLLTFLLLLFGEIIPKIYCQSRPLQVARNTSGIMDKVAKLLSPATRILVWIGTKISKVVRVKRFSLSADDLSKAIELTSETSEEKGMLTEIVKFYSKTASEVMTPRMDIAALEWNTPYNQVLDFVVEHGYSRIPVYQERIDTVKGILYAKDLLPHLQENQSYQWQNLLRNVMYVPETKKVDDLLEAFREQKMHMAIVVDEYGGTSGLVTMEDLLEEVVGEISDEYDEDDKRYSQAPDGSYTFDAKISLVDFIRIVHLKDTAPIEEFMDDVDTLGGLLLEIKGDFPEVGERIVLQQHTFEVLEMGTRRISKVRYTQTEHPTPEA